MNTQPEALRLATILQTSGWQPTQQEFLEAAAELRRLHEENERLRQALAQPQEWKHCWHCGFQYRPPKENKWHPLAQPEQEPDTVMAKYEFQTYAAYKTDGEMKIGVVPEHTAWVTAGKHTVPLYTAPPKREFVGLAKEEKFKVLKEFFGNSYQMIDAVEAKLKEKNGG